MKNTAYSILAWGLAFDLIDVRVLNFDLLPDIIGSLLLMRGAYRLGANNRYYRIAIAGSFLQAVVACAAIAGVRLDLPLLGSEEAAAPELIRVSVAIAAGMVTMLGLCQGIRADAEANGSHSVTRSARSTWNALFAIDGASLFLLPFLMNVAKKDLIWVMLLMGGASFIVHVRVFFLVRQAGRKPRGGPEARRIARNRGQRKLSPPPPQPET